MTATNEYKVLKLAPQKMRTHPKFRDACFHQLGVWPHLKVSFAEFSDWLALTETEPRDAAVELRESIHAFMQDKTVWFGTTSMLAREMFGETDLRTMSHLGKTLKEHPRFFLEVGIEVMRKPSNLPRKDSDRVTWITALHRIGHE